MGIATSIVLDLLNLVDPQAKALIDAAFQAGIIDRYVIGPRQVADTYRRGSDVPRAPRDWLEQYRRNYRDHVASERRLERDAWMPQPRPAPLLEGKKGKLGRNDPCWCGSGIKYKRCHMREDLGRA
jgi:hypothetical protein